MFGSLNGQLPGPASRRGGARRARIGLSGLVGKDGAARRRGLRVVPVILLAITLCGFVALWSNLAFSLNNAPGGDNGSGNVLVKGAPVTKATVMNKPSGWTPPPTFAKGAQVGLSRHSKEDDGGHQSRKDLYRNVPPRGEIDKPRREDEDVLLEKELQNMEDLVRAQEAAKLEAEAAQKAALDAKDRANPRHRSAAQWLDHSVVKSNTRLFHSISAYLTDNGGNASQPTADTDHLTLFLLGYGEFTSKALPKNELTVDTGLKVPNLECVFHPLGEVGEPIRAPVHVHSTGTAFEHKIHKGKVKYEGERTLLLSCGLGPADDSNAALGGRSLSSFDHNSPAGQVRIVSTNSDGFDTGMIKVGAFLATNYKQPSYRLVQCSSAVHHVTGTRWIIEWIEYHLALGFDHLHLYVVDSTLHSTSSGSPLKKVLEHYNKRGVVTVHDWGGVSEDLPPRVNIINWEHGQRATRNDCFFRNRGVAEYVAFSDLDELWALGDVGGLEGGELDLAGHSFATKKIESTINLRNNHPSDRLYYFFESANQADPNRVGFAFKSITVPPFTFDSLLKTANPEGGSASALADAWKRDIIPDPDHGLLFGQIQVSERKCQAPYNCGQFHKGRQKYFLRTSTGSLNPNVALFYHAINEDYGGVAGATMQQVPIQVGYIRHYAGHFKHSRLGGLAASNRVHRPLAQALLSAMRSAINGNTDLLQLYENGPPERFLGLGGVLADDVWRFAKPDDDRTRAEQRRQEENRDLLAYRKRRSQSFLTFEQFKGRLNNQLLTYDWAFRVSHAVGRTLYLETKVNHHEYWMGLPESKEEEAHHTSLWNFTGLRRRFHFVTDYDVADLHGSVNDHPVLGLPTSQLPPACVWKYKLVEKEKSWKNLLTWAKWATRQPECSERIHFGTHEGLVHPYRSDTRIEGVGQLAFWENMRPSGYLMSLVDAFLDEKFPNRKLTGGPLGMHLRSHNSYGPAKAARAKTSCIRLARKPVEHSMRYQKARATYCRAESKISPDQGLLWPPFSGPIQQIYDERLLEDMCEINAPVVDLALSFAQHRLGLTDPKSLGFFLASDHENKAADELIYSKGGLGYSYDADVVNKGDVRRRQFPDEARSKSDWRDNIQGVLIDMLLLSKVGVFFGNPGSTLTQVVCYWRMSDARANLSAELSNTCGLVMMSTGANKKDEIKC